MYIRYYFSFILRLRNKSFFDIDSLNKNLKERMKNKNKESKA